MANGVEYTAPVRLSPRVMQNLTGYLQSMELASLSAQARHIDSARQILTDFSVIASHALPVASLQSNVPPSFPSSFLLLRALCFPRSAIRSGQARPARARQRVRHRTGGGVHGHGAGLPPDIPQSMYVWWWWGTVCACAGSRSCYFRFKAWCARGVCCCLFSHPIVCAHSARTLTPPC